MSQIDEYRTVVNGHDFIAWPHVDTSLGRQLAATIDRADDSVQYIDPMSSKVTLWLTPPEDKQEMFRFPTPDGWRVVRTDYFGNGRVALNLKPEVQQ